MKKIVATLAFSIVALCVSMASYAQTPPAAPKPGPEHQKLAYFVGKWTVEGEMKASPMGPGGKMTSNDNCTWFSGHFAVVSRWRGFGLGLGLGRRRRWNGHGFRLDRCGSRYAGFFFLLFLFEIFF